MDAFCGGLRVRQLSKQLGEREWDEHDQTQNINRGNDKALGLWTNHMFNNRSVFVQRLLTLEQHIS